jgi:hypothetical protein
MASLRGVPVTAADDPTDPIDAQAAAVAEAEAVTAAGDLRDDAEAHDRAVETLTTRLGATLLDDDQG